MHTVRGNTSKLKPKGYENRPGNIYICLPAFAFASAAFASDVVKPLYTMMIIHVGLELM